MMNCQPHFSEKGTSKERNERKMMNFLQDFLQEIEMQEIEVPEIEVPEFKMPGIIYCIVYT